MFVFFCIFTTMELTKRVEFIVVIVSLVIITVDRCTCVFVAAVKQPTRFAEFHTLHQTYILWEKQKSMYH